MRPTCQTEGAAAGIDILAISPPAVIDVNRAVYRELSRTGWSVEIMIPAQSTYADGLRTPDVAAPDDPPLHRLRGTSSNQRLRTFHGLFGLLERRRPRIVYIDSDPASVLTTLVGLWARFRGSIVVCQSCDNLSRTLKASIGRSGIRGVLAWAVVRVLALAAKPNVACILSINADGLRVYSELGSVAGALTIPLGFDEALFRQDQNLRESTRERLGLRQPTIAFFGMLRSTKGVHVLIEALEGLLAHDWQLLIDRFEAYRDPYTAQIGSVLEHSPIRERVLFFDATHKEMPQYMNAADIVVLPSLSTPTVKEQYGRAVSEAMACGCMVIVSRSGALPELVGEAGLLVPENDVPALREALRRVLVDPELRSTLAHEALRRAHSKLGVRQQAAIMSRTFEQLLGHSTAAAVMEE